MKIKNKGPETPPLTPATKQAFIPLADPSKSTTGADAYPEQVQVDQLPRQNLMQAAEQGKTTLSRLIRTLTGQTPASRAVILGVVAAPAALTGVAHAQVATPTPPTNPLPDRFDPARLAEYPLFKMFWASDTPNDGTSHQGLEQVSVAGAEKLYQYARTHGIDGRVHTEQEPNAEETRLIKALLDHGYYGGFFGQEARTVVAQKFNIPVETVSAPSADAAPVSVGRIELPAKVTAQESLRGPLVETLGQLMKGEYEARRAYFEDPSASEDEKGKRVLGLFRDYAQALNSYGQLNTTNDARQKLLDAFEQLPFAAVHGAKDYNGAGWGAAQSILLGLDPNEFVTSFPDANANVPTTGLSMDGGMAPSMKFVDLYRVAEGQEARAEAYELKAPLGYVIGVESGHKKASYSFEEQKPFATSGLNWAKLLFPENSAAQKLEPKPGFEFPIDAVDAFGFAVTHQFGDRIVPIHANTNEPLNVSLVTHEEAGRPKYWSAKFTTASGQEVAPNEVKGLIKSASGQTKGDGRVDGVLGMGWWGFCAENTAQAVVKARFRIPQLDVETIKVKASNGQVVEFPMNHAQRILDADWEDVGGFTAYSGFRFDDQPQSIQLATGERINGRVQGLELIPGPASQWLGEDQLRVDNTAAAPFLGTVRLERDGGRAESVDLRNVSQIERDTATGKVKLHIAGRGYALEGTLKTELDFSNARTEGGKQILDNSPDRPVLGELSIKLPNGSERNVRVQQVSSVTGEVASDVRFSDFLGFVSRMDGVYGTDASLGSSISNGVRWANDIERVESHGGQRPEWMSKGPLTGSAGPLVREPGDKVIYARGLYKWSAESQLTSTFKGWVQMNAQGRILNEGFTEGAPDFAWAPAGPLDWFVSKNTFNPHVPSDLRIKLFVNGIQDMQRLEEMAERLNFPSNWREYRVAQ